MLTDRSALAICQTKRLSDVPKLQSQLPASDPVDRSCPRERKASSWVSHLRCRSFSGQEASTSGRKEPGRTDAFVPQSRKLRCALCFDPDLTNLTQLAEHLVGRRHTDFLPARDSIAACPYCSLKLNRTALYNHIRNGDCRSAGTVIIPKSQQRVLQQGALEEDPRFQHIVEEPIPAGLLRIRPMHLQHTFESALVVTDAFTVDMDPPRFGWMLSELRRQAAQYESNPSPVTRHSVQFGQKACLEAPSVADVVSETTGSMMDFFSGPDRAEQRDKQRREIESAWGVWIWLVADLIPNDAALLPAGQDSLVVGATAMMFHDRAASIEAIQLMKTPVSVSALDYSLWLRPFPPSDLDYKRAVFVWWTSVDPMLRRQGVARLLLRGCEAIGAAAGFWSFYIQAALRQRDRDSMLGSWLPREYGAAVAAYQKAGYKEYLPQGEAGSLWSRSMGESRTAALMYKRF